MEMTDAKVVEKKIYEDGKKEYASKGLAGTALGIGIGGLALALLNGYMTNHSDKTWQEYLVWYNKTHKGETKK